MKLRLVFALAALLLLSRAAAAQSTGAYITTFAANVDLAYHEPGDNSVVGAHFDVAHTVKRDVPFVAVVGEAGVNHFENANIATVMGGARIRIPIDDNRFLPFAEAMFGLYHCGACSENDPAFQAGGGVDFVLPRQRNFRLRGQIDFRHVFGEFVGFDALRVSGGIVLPLNGR